MSRSPSARSPGPHTHVDYDLLAAEEPFVGPSGSAVDRWMVTPHPSLPGTSGAACGHTHLVRGTPSRIWIEHQLREVFRIDREFGGDATGEFYEERAERGV